MTLSLPTSGRSRAARAGVSALAATALVVVAGATQAVAASATLAPVQCSSDRIGYSTVNLDNTDGDVNEIFTVFVDNAFYGWAELEPGDEFDYDIPLGVTGKHTVIVESATDWESEDWELHAEQELTVSCGMPNPGFKDVPASHTLYDEIAWLANSGVTAGYGDKTFRGTKPVIRYHMASFLYRYVDAGGWEHDGEPSFSDVPASHALFDEVEFLAEFGVTTGYGDGTYRGMRNVTRGELTTFLWRLVGEPGHNNDPQFTDVSATHPFRDAIAWASEAGIVNGYGDGSFRAGQQVSRQHMAAMLYRLNWYVRTAIGASPNIALQEGAPEAPQSGVLEGGLRFDIPEGVLLD